MTPRLTPRLIVVGADRAIDFYRSAFGARLIERYADDAGRVVHAAMAFGDAVVALAEERPDWQNIAPTTLGGSPVVLNLVVADADAVGAALAAAGADTVFPIADQVYGHREGRFRDPFGHLWIVTTVIQALSPDQIDARMRGA